MAREDLHFRLRIPEMLKLMIESAAEGNHRSMTAEIIDRLERSFRNESRDSLTNKRLDELARSIDEQQAMINELARAQKGKK